MRYFSALILIFLVGCASSGMSSERENEIPRGANALILVSELSPDELYRQAYQRVRKAGLRMDESNEEMNSFATDGGPVGESSSTMRLDVFIEDADPGSKLTARADVQITGFGWMRASMAGRGSDPRVAFEELVLLVESVPHQEIRYVEK